MQASSRKIRLQSSDTVLAYSIKQHIQLEILNHLYAQIFNKQDVEIRIYGMVLIAYRVMSWDTSITNYTI